MKILGSLFQRYVQRLQTKPYSTKMATSCFIFTTSDFICQRFVEKKTSEDYSYLRTFRQAMFGTLYGAPILHLWHSKFIPRATSFFKNKFQKVAASYALGEGVFSPYSLAVALFSFELLNSYRVENATRNVKEKFWPTLFRSFQFWGVISLFTYSVVPIYFRPVWTNCWSLTWQIYLSFIANFKQDSVILEDSMITEGMVKLAL